jgi:membrane fusion protein (multidrug efflux system)
MSIVPLGQTYVVANFKETQVGRLRIGQPVEIHADAFGDAVIRGQVESFAPATGSEFALIPVENAVGNFTKVVQRLPVRVAVNRDDKLAGALRPGLSVEVKVDVQAPTPGPASPRPPPPTPPSPPDEQRAGRRSARGGSAVRRHGRLRAAQGPTAPSPGRR